MMTNNEKDAIRCIAQLAYIAYLHSNIEFGFDDIRNDIKEIIETGELKHGYHKIVAKEVFEDGSSVEHDITDIIRKLNDEQVSEESNE